MIHEVPYTASIISNIHCFELDIGGVVKLFHDDVLECCGDVGFQVEVVDIGVVYTSFLSSRTAPVSLASKVRAGGAGSITNGALCWIAAYCCADMHNPMYPYLPPPL